MIRHKWIVGKRNVLADMIMAFDSAAAIEGSKLTPSERKDLQDMIRKALNYIDDKIFQK